MKIRQFFFLILSCILLFSSVVGVGAEEIVATQGCHSPDAVYPIAGSDKLLDTSKAVAVYERSSDTLIYGYHLDQKIYPASMVKLMTGIVAIENGNLSDVVTVTRSALNSEPLWYVSAGLVRGEEITLENLLYCMMVASYNDACAMIAEFVGGTQAQFFDMMNEKAAQLGCTGTHFSNAHGLHNPETYTTARDILKILDYALENETFRLMFETVEYTVPATNLSPERKLVTTNQMMRPKGTSKYADERVTGGKTGSTDAAGRCLTVTANAGGMELIAIVMGAQATYDTDGSLKAYGSFEEMGKLLDFIQKNYECRQLLYAGQVITQYPVANGSNHVVVQPEAEVSCVLPKEITREEIQWKYAQSVTPLTAPIAKDQIITDIEMWYGNICLGKTGLCAINEVAVYKPYEEPKSTTNQKEEEAHGELLAMILFGILLLAVAVIVLMFVIRIVQNALLRARLRRRRKERRRNRNARME